MVRLADAANGVTKGTKEWSDPASAAMTSRTDMQKAMVAAETELVHDARRLQHRDGSFGGVAVYLFSMGFHAQFFNQFIMFDPLSTEAGQADQFYSFSPFVQLRLPACLPAPLWVSVDVT